MNPRPSALSIDPRIRREEIRALLAEARSEGITVYPDPDRRSIVLRANGNRLPLTRLGPGTLAGRLMQRDREVHDHLRGLLNLVRAIHEDEGAVPSSLPSPGEFPEGAAALTHGTDRPGPRDGAPSIHTAECMLGMEPCPSPGPAGAATSPSDDPGVSPKDEASATVAAACFGGLVILGIVVAILKACGVTL